MRKHFFTALTILTIILINGCASSYMPINPPSINYTSHDLQDGVSLSYKYDVLREKNNKKYSKKEIYNRIKLLTVKITNNTDSVLSIGKDFAFYSGNKQINLIEPIALQKIFKQSSASYLFYLLLTPLKLYVADNNSVETYSIGYALGPTLAVGNLLVASSANSNFQKELNHYNIINTNIEKGETVYGIIGLDGIGYDPICIKNINKTGKNYIEKNTDLSLEDIIESKVNPNKDIIYELKNNLYKIDTIVSYEKYYDRIIKLSAHPDIETIEISSENYSNGNLKSIGLKAKHNLQYHTDDIYSSSNYYNEIGTWRYFFENGQLKKVIDYDLNKNKDGRYIEYDNFGNILNEITYKSGKKIK
jgi:hypothetical protein